jgi:uncharacterized transporter YbjL
MEVSQFLKNIRLYDESVNKHSAPLRDSARLKETELYITQLKRLSLFAPK